MNNDVHYYIREKRIKINMNSRMNSIIMVIFIKAIIIIIDICVYFNYYGLFYYYNNYNNYYYCYNLLDSNVV